MDQQKKTPATLSIRWSTIAAAAAGVCFGMVIGAFGVQQAIQHRPIMLDMLIADAGAKVCINGFSYQFKPSNPVHDLGVGVEVLHLITEPKGEIQHDASNGYEIPRPMGPKACQLAPEPALYRADEQLVREQAEAHRQREAEAQRLREAEEQQRRVAEAERQRQAAEAAEAAMQRQLAGEAEAARNAQQAEQAANSFINIVRRRVEQKWSIPDGARDSMSATLQARLGQSGELLATSIVTSSGDSTFDRSVMQAVEHSAPFGELRNLPANQQRNLRQFNLRFTPGDIR